MSNDFGIEDYTQNPKKLGPDEIDALKSDLEDPDTTVSIFLALRMITTIEELQNDLAAMDIAYTKIQNELLQSNTLLQRWRRLIAETIKDDEL